MVGVVALSVSVRGYSQVVVSAADSFHGAGIRTSILGSMIIPTRVPKRLYRV